MKLHSVLLFVLAAALPAQASATERFFDRLTPEERRLAGIENLTEGQRSALNLLADRWVEARAEPAIAAARDRAAAEVREQAQLEAKKRIGFDNTPKPGVDVIRAHLLGTFRGWGKGTIFRLDNGQTWAVDAGSADSRYFSARENAEVEIRPAAFGTWKFYILPEGLWVRVKRVQ